MATKHTLKMMTAVHNFGGCQCEPTEADVVFSDYDGPFYCEGRCCAQNVSELREFCRDYYPDFYCISDHGNSCHVSAESVLGE